MTTEITECNGWVFYDGECAVCLRAVALGHDLLVRHRFHLVPLQTPWVSERLALSQDKLLSEMKLLTGSGMIVGGADAFVYIARCIWWAWPIYAFCLIPGVKSSLRVAYRYFAARRHCLNGLCKVPKACPKKHAHRHGAGAFYELP